MITFSVSLIEWHSACMMNPIKKAQPLLKVVFPPKRASASHPNKRMFMRHWAASFRARPPPPTQPPGAAHAPTPPPVSIQRSHAKVQIRLNSHTPIHPRGRHFVSLFASLTPSLQIVRIAAVPLWAWRGPRS